MDSERESDSVNPPHKTTTVCVCIYCQCGTCTYAPKAKAHQKQSFTT